MMYALDLKPRTRAKIPASIQDQQALGFLLEVMLEQHVPSSQKGGEATEPSNSALVPLQHSALSLPYVLSFPLSGLCLSTRMNNKFCSACRNLGLHCSVQPWVTPRPRCLLPQDERWQLPFTSGCLGVPDAQENERLA